MLYWLYQLNDCLIVVSKELIMKKNHWQILALIVCLVAVALFAACNKEDITPTVEQGNKSIALSIANLAPTKTANSDQVADNSAVKLNSFQVFFVDGTTKQLYTPKTVDASAAAATDMTPVGGQKRLVLRSINGVSGF